MNPALSNQSFFALNKGKHRSEFYRFPKNLGSIYVSTLYEIANSDLLHYHEEPHLTFIINGGVLDKRKNIEEEKLSGELMFFHAGEPHQTINKLFPTKYITLQFESDFLKQHFLNETKIKSSIEQNQRAKFTILKIYKELSIADEFSNCSLEMLLYNLIEEKNAIKNARPNWLNQVIELLNDNWNLEFSVSDLALAANVHPKTISKYFPKYFACTLGEYRRKLKIEKSLSLIKNSKSSLTEIAYECGFYDQSHFTGIFKEMTGFLPKQFKNL